MIKKLLIALSLLFLLAGCDTAWALNYYVRCDGGTATQCDGTHDAPQSGAVDGPDAGTVPDCAWNSPNWAGANQNTGGQASAFTGGDTIIIDGEQKSNCVSSTVSGRAEYDIGLNAPNMPSGVNCNLAFPYGCVANIWPSGPSIGSKTKIYGKGWDVGCPRPPQLFGDWGADHVLQIGSFTDVRCLEITDHSGCVFRHRGAGNIDNDINQDPIQCSETYTTTTSAGKYSRIGIKFNGGSHDVDLTDVWSHGMAYHGVFADSLTGAINLTRFHLRGNGFDGWTGNDNAHYVNTNGTYSWIYGDLDYSGCGEKYPATNVFSNLRSNSDIRNCWSQDQGGYGDAIALSARQGSWLFNHLDCFGNVSDCIDHLYDSTSTLKVVHSTFEANAGSAVKSAEPTVYVENNVLLGNCVWWLTNPAVYGSPTATGRTGSACNNNGVCNANENYVSCGDCAAFNYCRPAAHSTISLGARPGVLHKVIGNTISGNDDVNILETQQTPCDGTGTVTIKNNVFLGATEFNGGQTDTSDIYYNDCTGTQPTVIQDYNHICQSKTVSSDCIGAHDQCYTNCSSLNMVGPLKNFTPNYYTGTNYIAAYYLQSTSPAHGPNAADETVSLQDTPNDATNFNRRLTWDAGGLEYRPTVTISTDYWRISQ